MTFSSRSFLSRCSSLSSQLSLTSSLNVSSLRSPSLFKTARLPHCRSAFLLTLRRDSPPNFGEIWIESGCLPGDIHDNEFGNHNGIFCNPIDSGTHIFGREELVMGFGIVKFEELQGRIVKLEDDTENQERHSYPLL